MAYQESRIGQIRVAEQGGWGTAATSFSLPIEAEVGAYPSLATEAIFTDALRSHHYHPAVQAGAKSATISLTMPLHGWSSGTPSGAATAGDRTADQILVEHAFGSMTYSGHTTDAAWLTGGTTGSVEYGAGQTPAGVDIGEAVLVPVTGGTRSVGWVANRDVDGAGGSDSHTLINKLSNTPTSSGLVYGGMVAAMVRGTHGTPLTIQVKFANSNSCLRIFDAVVSSMSLDINPKEVPKLTVEIQAANWVNDGTGGAPGNYDYASYEQLPVSIGANGSRLLLGENSANVITFNFSLTNEVVEAKSHSGDQGLSQFVIVNRSASCTYTQPSESITAQQPGHSQLIQVDLGTSEPGNCVSLIMPNAVLTNQAQIGDDSGLVAETFEYAAGLVTGDSSDTAPGNTSARLAFL